MKFQLSDMHMNAVNRKRGTIAHWDALDVIMRWGGINEVCGGSYLDAYRKRAWEYVDKHPEMFDSIHWDACFEDEYAFCHKSYLPQMRLEQINKMYGAGIDLYDELTDQCKKRNIESVLVHRISEPDMVSVPEGLPLNVKLSPMKISNPEYYIDDWMRMANIASPEMRAHKLKMLTECIQNYTFDGLEIDFCRHTPFLEPGKQWELRENVTEFMRMLREMTQRVEREQGRAILLSARVPQTVEGCHADGLDIEKWAEERLVDTLTVGSRCYDVDINGFRKATRGTVKIFPCFDTHHQTDAYAEPPLAVYMGVLSNWWAQGADGIVFFNHDTCSVKTYLETHGEVGGGNWDWSVTHLSAEDNLAQTEAICKASNISEIRAADKTYVIERRGGYPWENGYANNNNDRQLPIALSNNGREAEVTMYVADPVAHIDTKSLKLSVLVYGLSPEDKFTIKLNGTPIDGMRLENCKDKEIIPFGKELVSGYNKAALPERDDVFTRIDCEINPAIVVKGENRISFSVRRMLNYKFCTQIEIERVELEVKY